MRCNVLSPSGERCPTRRPPPRSEGGRAKGAPSIPVTRNEILYALNQADKFILAIVLVQENDQTEGPYHLQNPFTQEPDYGVASINYDLGELIARVDKL